MTRRWIPGAVIAVAIAVCLTGCQTTTGGFTRSAARADVASWTKQAVAAVGSPAPTSATRADAFETCRSDHGFFTTTSQWRTITNISVPLARQSAATRAIEAAFVADHWAVSRPSGLATITGPKGVKLKGLITVQTASDTQLALTVISPCYK